MNICFSDLTVSEEYYNLLPKLTEEEYSKLEKSLRGGYWSAYPIVVNPEGVILDGHHRFKICKKYGITPAIQVMSFGNKLDEIDFVIDANASRRQLTTLQACELAEVKLENARKRAKERQKKAGELFGRGQERVDSQEAKLSEGKSTEDATEGLPVSRATFERYLYVKEEAPEELEKLKKSEKGSITSLEQKVRKKKKREKRNRELKRKAEELPLPDRKCDVVVADPPWRYSFSKSDSRKVENQYPTLTTQEICDLDFPCEDNSVLFLWATAPKLEESLRVMESWGFEYKTCAVWDKLKIGMGYWFRGQHELLLVGVKGEFSPPEPENRFSSVIKAERGVHSEKPVEVCDMIEEMFPDGKYLELFARGKRDGWESWGVEVAD